MVLSFTMPQHGLLPTESSRFWDLDPDYQNAIPSSLFLVNKAMSANARDILKKEVYLVIELSPEMSMSFGRITFLNTYLRDRGKFLSHRTLAHVGHFKHMSNFELDLMTDRFDPWWFMEEGVAAPIVECERYKESLRLICDTLATYNDQIQHLVIQVPCLCRLKNTAMAHLAESMLLDFLGPLRRLRVAKPISFRITHKDDDDAWDPVTRDPLRTEGLVQTFEANFGRLLGEELSKEEETWKEIKAMDRAQLKTAGINMKDVLGALWSVLIRNLGHFDACAEQAKSYVYRKLRKQDDRSLSETAG